MAVQNIYENGLNVQYVSKFIEKEYADHYLTELRCLPFYTPTFKTRGKCAKSKPLVLAYGDENLSYVFSGVSIPAEPWNDLMLELRDRVEKFAACSFNYVLLNFYANGSSYISQHKDDESGLDATFPIVVLSFGAERTLEFKKPHTSSTVLKLEHGSLYSILKPTNKLFTHGITPELNVKDMTISLTFRHLIANPMCPPMKKPRLQRAARNNCEKDCLPSTSSSANEPESSSSSSASEKDISSSSACEKDISPSNNCEKDILASTNTCDQDMNLLIHEWNLNWNTVFKIILNNNCNIRLHIHGFKESRNDMLKPTRQGIVMTPNTWSEFISKIGDFKLQSVNETFVCNNQLIVFSVNPDFCLMQQIFPLNTLGFFLKPSILKLYNDQVFKLKELLYEITECVIESILTVQLPTLIVNSPAVCFSHLTIENARHNFLDCLSSEIIHCVRNLMKCEACLTMPNSQDSHTCGKSPLDHFILNRQEILLNLNLNNIVKNLLISCSCQYTADFFKEWINQNMEMLDEYFEYTLSRYNHM